MKLYDFQFDFGDRLLLERAGCVESAFILAIAARIEAGLHRNVKRWRMAEVTGDWGRWENEELKISVSK